MKRLLAIQQSLKVPKGQYNSFGGYKFRNCEDILEAVKPLLAEVNLVLFCNDQIVLVGERYYIQATITLVDAESGETIASSQAVAREEEHKKGMDGSQITGASSSYARKYALNGLFAIDDTKDSDATNTHGKESKNNITDQDLKNALIDEQIAKEEKKFKCSDCGVEITARAYDYSYNHFGKGLCMKCQNNAKKLKT